MNVLELRKQIQTFLLTLCDRVYHERATETTAYPYIVFTLSDSFELEGNREDFDVEIDVWGLSSNTVELETLVGNIDGDGSLTNPTGLHRKLIYDNGVLSAKLYRDRRLVITDEDVRIRRRQLKYNVQTYL